MGSQSLRAYFLLIRDNRNFRRLWIAQIVSEIGDWFTSSPSTACCCSSPEKLSLPVWH
jgi:hypothetical protein